MNVYVLLHDRDQAEVSITLHLSHAVIRPTHGKVAPCVFLWLWVAPIFSIKEALSSKADLPSGALLTGASTGTGTC